MQELVTLPWWQFLLLVLLSLYALIKLLVLPLLQGYIYRRSVATQKTLGEELDFGLPAYALASRQIWLDRLMNDSGVRQLIEQTAAETGQAIDEVEQQTRQHAEEIVPSFNVLIYFRLGYWLARVFLRLYYWILVVQASDSVYNNIPSNSLVVLVSNHRSNFDPLLLIYLASKRAPISFSAGEWAVSFPFRQLVHLIGFYIVRRGGLKDRLFRRVLERYVFLAASQCVPQGLFLEGVLSRDGTMQPIKLGMLNYLVKAHGKGSCEDIFFIPTAINYDKIPEDRTLIAHRRRGFGNKGKFYSLVSFIKFIVTVTTYVVPRRHKPFGYAVTQFGTPVSLNDWQKEKGFDLAQLEESARREGIEKLGADLGESIKTLIPILPTNVLAQVLATSDDLPISEIELKVRALDLLKELSNQGAPVILPHHDEDYALSQGIYVLLRRKLIRPTGDGRFELLVESEDLLAYYRNTIAHYIS